MGWEGEEKCTLGCVGGETWAPGGKGEAFAGGWRGPSVSGGFIAAGAVMQLA